MIQVRVSVEYREQGAAAPALRWERVAVTSGLAGADEASNLGRAEGGEGTATFELLGRAFELAQREENAPFATALAAFFRGALIRKEDLGEVSLKMDDPGR